MFVNPFPRAGALDELSHRDSSASLASAATGVIGRLARSIWPESGNISDAETWLIGHARSVGAPVPYGMTMMPPQPAAKVNYCSVLEPQTQNRTLSKKHGCAVPFQAPIAYCGARCWQGIGGNRLDSKA